MSDTDEKGRAEGSHNSLVSKELARWQRLVLPVMGLMVVGAGIFFAFTIIQETRHIYSKIEQAPASLAPHFERFEALQPDAASEMHYVRFKASALLEADALQRRYQQTNAAMLSRVWTRQMGFLTGMLMALIGSAFILGRIETSETKLSGEAKSPEPAGAMAKAALATTSPGLVLAALGALLMGITIVIPGRISTTDAPVYLMPKLTFEGAGGLGAPSDGADFMDSPPDLPPEGQE